MERSATLTLLGPTKSPLSESSWSDSNFQTCLLVGREALLETGNSAVVDGRGPKATESEIRDWRGTVAEDEADESDREALTCSYLHLLP